MQRKTFMAPAIVVAITAATAVASAHAGPVANEFGPNLVVNGGFEATPGIASSGWTVSGFLGEGIDHFIDGDSAHAHNGTRSFAGGAVGTFGSISQTLATTPGMNYNIHLWLANISGFADGTGIEVRWNGNVVYSATDILGFGYREIVVDPLATSTSTILSIALQDDSFFLNVDDISVRLVPEPAGLALAGMALAGLLLVRRKAG
ncbi:PEP-CTERM sorting domain-containing protein [Piscinibacter koreensis]|uniref:PEP-CTERM sorting domain-containing protein n=1 Tax=Piscinibacter koreensis TaxID=2742824 RepID=A0A7Y6TY59_9BURK|nr:PEP-CTERM sorting domain-containing protein [Schlegelella koreensis]NUZ07761.1 PEP-CTERM sorting domain-containing protein [Schlegelella koreensis]